MHAVSFPFERFLRYLNSISSTPIREEEGTVLRVDSIVENPLHHLPSSTIPLLLPQASSVAM